MALANGDDGFLVIPVSVGGVAARAMLDSGATRSILDSGFAARHGIIPVRARHVTGLSGDTLAGLAPPLDIAAGSVRLQQIEPLVLDLADIARAAGASFEVVLGRELFLQSAIAIDPDAQRLSLDPDRAMPGALLPITQTRDRHFCTEIELVRGLPADAMIDLGCTAPLYVSPRFAESHRLFAGLRRGSSAAIGVEGIAISQLGRLPRLRFGDLTLRDIPFAVPARWNFAAPVILGLPLLMRFRSLLDFGRGCMRLAPARALERPFARDRSGLSVIPSEGGLQVIHIADHSPAAQAGLVAGDTIVAIDDGNGGAQAGKAHRGLGKRPPGTRYLLSVKGKGRCELVLVDYY